MQVLFLILSEKIILRSDFELIKILKKSKILYMSNFGEYISPLNFKKSENNCRLFLIILTKFQISGQSVVYLENLNFVKFQLKIKHTLIQTISVLIELVAKTYGMGKNNSGATPPHAPMRISTPTPLGAFHPISKSRNTKI